MLGVPGPTIPLSPDLVLAGRYRLAGPVRPGATNSYLAYDAVRDGPVVVKLLGAMPFEPDLERVGAAFEPLESLDAAFLPRIHEAFMEQHQDRHCVFLVQEQLEVESLEERVKRGGPLGPGEVRALARRLLELLRKLDSGERPLVHGDINPSNLLVSEGGAVALVDWAAPKAAARDWSADSYGPEGWTQAVQRAFAAPEVPMGAAKPRSDLYGAGACLAYALTGLDPEALRDRDPRRVLKRALEQFHVPRSLAAVLVPMLEPTVDRRLASAQEAMELLLDPLAGRRDGGSARPVREEPDWHLEPSPGLGRLWSGVGVVLASLLALPLLVAAAAVAVPVLHGMGGWVILVRLGLGLGLGVGGLVSLVAGARAFSPMGRLRVQGTSRGLRYQLRRGWTEIPWLQVGRAKKVGPLLRVDGLWSRPRSPLPKRGTLWLAPVYDDDLDRVLARIGAHRARARSLISGSLRPSERAWPGPRRPPLGFALGAGLFALAAVAFTARWGADEPEPSAGVLHARQPGIASLVPEPAAPGADPSPAPRALDALSELAARRPGSGPDAREVLHSFQQALARTLGAPPPEPPALPEPEAVAPGEPPAAALAPDFGQAVHPLAQDAPAATVAPAKEAKEVPQVGAPPPARGRCPAGLEARALAPATLMPAACWDERGTMVWVATRGSRHGFLVDWTEVSVADYASCVAEGGCTVTARGPGCYGSELSRARYPVNCVDREQAEAYCAWAGRRLCSAAEHATAARGPGGAPYPWGEEAPSCAVAVMDGRGLEGPNDAPGCGRGGPWAVGSRAAGVSASGALDLSGNLAEWVAGSPEGAAGGSYMDRAPEELRADGLRPIPPDFPLPDVGFRCCRGGS